MVSWGLCNNILQAGGLKQWKCILSHSWRPGIQEQGVSGATFPLEALGDGSSRLFQRRGAPGVPWLGPHRSSLCSVFTRLYPLCESVCLLLVLQGCQTLETGPTLTQYGLVLTHSHLRRPFFQTRSHIEVPSRLFNLPCSVGARSWFSR